MRTSANNVYAVVEEVDGYLYVKAKVALAGNGREAQRVLGLADNEWFAEWSSGEVCEREFTPADAQEWSQTRRPQTVYVKKGDGAWALDDVYLLMVQIEEDEEA